MIAPSNPITSVGPILAVPGIAGALARADARIVAISPIIGSAAFSGPAAKLMAMRGLAASAAGVARAYHPFLDVLIADDTGGTIWRVAYSAPPQQSGKPSSDTTGTAPK